MARKKKPAPVIVKLKKRSPRHSRDKGAGFEREMVKLLCEAGIYAEKVPLSGAVKGGSFEGDIDVQLPGKARVKFECKIRARAWADLYHYLEGNFGLFIRRDRGEPLVVLRLDDFCKLHGEQW